MNRAQAVALAVSGATYTIALVFAFWLHPKFTATVVGVLGVSLVVIVACDGRSIGRGRDEWDGRR